MIVIPNSLHNSSGWVSHDAITLYGSRISTFRLFFQIVMTSGAIMNMPSITNNSTLGFSTLSFRSNSTICKREHSFAWSLTEGGTPNKEPEYFWLFRHCRKGYDLDVARRRRGSDCIGTAPICCWSSPSPSSNTQPQQWPAAPNDEFRATPVPHSQQPSIKTITDGTASALAPLAASQPTRSGVECRSSSRSKCSRSRCGAHVGCFTDYCGFFWGAADK